MCLGRTTTALVYHGLEVPFFFSELGSETIPVSTTVADPEFECLLHSSSRSHSQPTTPTAQTDTAAADSCRSAGLVGLPDRCPRGCFGTSTAARGACLDRLAVELLSANPKSVRTPTIIHRWSLTLAKPQNLPRIASATRGETSVQCNCVVRAMVQTTVPVHRAKERQHRRDAPKK
jgi:hypothetical protein